MQHKQAHARVGARMHAWVRACMRGCADARTLFELLTCKFIVVFLWKDLDNLTQNYYNDGYRYI